MNRHLLGSWTTLAGTGIEVFVIAGHPTPELECQWDHLPVSVADQVDYIGRLLPQITKRAREHFEIGGAALVVLG